LTALTPELKSKLGSALVEISLKTSLRHDLRAQSELLAYLVISNLLTRHATGDWMSVGQTVESVHMWLHSNMQDEDLMRRVKIATRAAELAQTIVAEHHLALNGSIVASMFDQNLRLDFSSELARAIYQRCLTFLLKTRWYV
jgi:hypothetical protein